VTSPQAFEGLRLADRRVRAPEKTLAHMIAWVNAELMKNVAEMHLTRRYHALAC
jgi:homoaconitase/3-isopropylmalate dehydratase large subunit